jgi:hypothetical protein
MSTRTKETSATTPNARVCNEDCAPSEDNFWTDNMGIPGQDGISNVSDEYTYDIISVHQSQLQPSNNQNAIIEIEEMTTHPLKQKNAQCKVASRLKKPHVIKSDEFLW